MKRTQRMIGWLHKQVHVFERLSEHRLLTKVQQGDKEAFGQLYLLYLDSIYRYIFFRVNQDRAIAEDVTQTVFFKAWQGIDTFTKEQGNFRAWLYRIAHNCVIDYYKISKPTGRFDETLADSKTTEILEERLDTENTLEKVKHAMNVLTDEQKTVIILKFVDGLSNEEISKVLKKNEDAIRALQYRGLERLRKMFNNHE